MQHVTYIPQEVSDSKIFIFLFLLCIQQKVNVYDIVRREKLVLTVSALRALEDRIIAQYEHSGKMRALYRGVESVRESD